MGGGGKTLMEMGSFLELQFPQTGEFYAGETNIARLNTGRAAIWHAFRCTGCETVWLPYYQCDTVRAFFKRKNVPIKYYHTDRNFLPVDLAPGENEAVLFVNDYGMMSAKHLSALAATCLHPIIDNCQSFFTEPLSGCYNVYSCRKFVGVPDGAYVIGEHAERYCEEYPLCHSSDTALFLLQRIEYGCEGKAYESRRQNEDRIDREDAMRMSVLTKTILGATDYSLIREKRRENFAVADACLRERNQIHPRMYMDETCVPMVYPLVVEDDGLLGRLQEKKHFQGHWWSYLLDEMPADSFEYWISRYVIPITIDQRYSEEEIKNLCAQIE